MFRGVLPLVAGSIWLTVGLGEARPPRRAGGGSGGGGSGGGGGGGSGEDESEGEAEAEASQPNRVAVPHFAPWLKHDDDAVPAVRRRRYSVCLQASPISSAGRAPHFQSGGTGPDSRRGLRTPYWPAPSLPVRSRSETRVDLARALTHGSFPFLVCRRHPSRAAVPQTAGETERRDGCRRSSSAASVTSRARCSRVPARGSTPPRRACLCPTRDTALPLPRRARSGPRRSAALAAQVVASPFAEPRGSRGETRSSLPPRRRCAPRRGRATAARVALRRVALRRVALRSVALPRGYPYPYSYSYP